MNLQEIINTIRKEDAVFDKYADADMVDIWASWYKGKAAFHTYFIYNGKKRLQMTRKSLGMAKRSCEDWANLLLNEKTFFVIDDKKTSESVDAIFESVKFNKKANGAIEKSFALGGGALVWKVNATIREDGKNTKDGEIKLAFFNRKKYVPVTVEDGEVVECAFFQTKGKTTNIALHKINEQSGNYEIINATATGDNLDSLTLDADSVYIFDTKSKYPLFAIIEPNIQNNIDINSPFGISVFANAIDIMEGLDVMYDSEVNEYILGRKRIFTQVVSDMVVDPATGETHPVFDAGDLAVYELPAGMDGKSLIQDSTQPLRIEEHETGIQANLNRFSAAVGFGGNRYKYDKGTIATATQVISEDSDMFRSLKKHENLLSDRLIPFIKALLSIANEFTKYAMKVDAGVKIQYDDSIIEDKTAQKASDRQDVAQGLMAKWEYRVNHYGETEKEAKAMIDEIDALRIPDNDLDEGDLTDGSGA